MEKCEKVHNMAILLFVYWGVKAVTMQSLNPFNKSALLGRVNRHENVCLK